MATFLKTNPRHQNSDLSTKNRHISSQNRGIQSGLKKRTYVHLAVGAVWWGIFLLIPSLVMAQDLILEEESEGAASQEDTLAESLLEMGLEELLDVEISVASKKAEPLYEAPGVVAVVPREEFEIYGDRNLYQLMQRQPSVYTRSSYVYSNSMAGFRGDMSAHSETHTLLLLNGRPIRESAQAINWPVYMHLPLSFLESVEMIRGPGSVLYGTNAFAGVVNLKSRTIPEKSEFSISSLGGSHGYYNSDIFGGGKTGDLGFVGSFRVAGQQGYRYRMTDGQGVYGADNQNEKSLSGTAHLEYKGLTFDIFGSEAEAFELGVLPFWFIPEHEIRNKKLFFNMGYRVPLHERIDLDFNLTYNRQENELSSHAITRIGTNTSDVIGEVTLLANPLDDLNVIMGYLQEYQRNYKPAQDLFQSIPSYDYEPKCAYLQGDYKIGKIIKLIAGGQWHRSGLGVTDIISRGVIIITPFEKWGVKLLRGEAFRAPIAIESDLYDPPVLVGNDNLEPETITTYDAQLFYQDKNTYAALTYFHSLVDKQIVFDTSTPSSMTYMNGGEQTFDGIEFEAKHFLTPRWHVLGSFLHQENDADIGINPSVVPENMAKLGTGYSWDGGSASIFYSYFGTPPRIHIPGATLVTNPTPDAVNLLSLNVRLDVSKLMGLDKGQSILTLRAENLLNEEIHVPTMAYAGTPNSFPNGSGIMLYGGLTINF